MGGWYLSALLCPQGAQGQAGFAGCAAHRLWLPTSCGFPQPLGFRSLACQSQGQRVPLSAWHSATALTHGHTRCPVEHRLSGGASATTPAQRQVVTLGTLRLCHCDAPAWAPDPPPVPSPLCPFPPRTRVLNCHPSKRPGRHLQRVRSGPAHTSSLVSHLEPFLRLRLQLEPLSQSPKRITTPLTTGPLHMPVPLGEASPPQHSPFSSLLFQLEHRFSPACRTRSRSLGPQRHYALLCRRVGRTPTPVCHSVL